MPRLRAWLGVMRLPRSSKIRPVSSASDLSSCGLVIVDLGVELGLNRVEQLPLEDGRLLARQHLALERHLADVEPVAQQVGQRTAREGNAANGSLPTSGSGPWSRCPARAARPSAGQGCRA